MLKYQSLCGAALLAGTLVLTACSDNDQRDPVEIEQVSKRYGQTEQVTTTLVLRVRQPGKDTLTFTADCWLGGDNTSRIKATKMGVAFLDALIQPNQDFTTILVRDDEVITGALGDLAPNDENGNAAGSILINLAQFTAEAKRGPIPPNTSQQADGSFMADLGDGMTASLTLHADGFSVAEKTISYQGEPKFTVNYPEKHYQAIDNRLWRPMRADIEFPGKELSISVKVRDLQPLQELPGGIFSLKEPKNARHIDAEALRQRLTE